MEGDDGQAVEVSGERVFSVARLARALLERDAAGSDAKPCTVAGMVKKTTTPAGSKPAKPKTDARSPWRKLDEEILKLEERQATRAVDRAIRWARLRTTLCTTMVRAGVTPTILQRAMRHADIRTTLKHYTRLQLADVAVAFDALPAIISSSVSLATGTANSVAVSCENSGSSSGSSRHTKPRKTACSGGKQSTSTASTDDSQSTSRREDTGRFAKQRASVLLFPITRAISSAG